MPNRQYFLAFALGIAVIGQQPTPVSANKLATYLGNVGGDPEKDTYGLRREPQPAMPLAMLGPAIYIGAVSGDPEKGTFGFRAVVETCAVRRRFQGRMTPPDGVDETCP